MKRKPVLPVFIEYVTVKVPYLAIPSQLVAVDVHIEYKFLNLSRRRNHLRGLA